MTKRKRPEATGLNSGTTTTIIADTNDLSTYIIPLRGKIPAVSGTWKRSFTDEEFPEGCNYGLRLGEKTEWGYLTVIDYDGSEHFSEFLSFLREKGVSIDTIAVKTGGKHNGYHLYYWSDEAFTGRFKGQFDGVDVEILGKGTYTVIPPSTVLTDYRLVKAFTEKEPITYQVSSVSDFLTEIEGASGVLYTQIQDLQRSLEQKSAPSNYNSSYLVHFSPISSDLLLWELILNDSYKSIYNEELHLSKSLRFKCVFHKEKNPSANLFWIDDKAKFVYHDFHNGNNYDLVEVFHALKNHQEPKFLESKNSRKWLEGLLELFEWIDENRITTGFGERFDRWRDDFLGKLSLTGGGVFKEYILDTLKTILEISRDRINKGINELVLSKRFVADRVDWTGSDKNKAKIVNRAMNFLVFAGILIKGRDLSTQNGRTYIFSIDFKCKASDVEKAWDEIVKAGLSNYNDFNKNNVADLFGERRANEIFRASAIERGSENGLQNNATEQLPEGKDRGKWKVHRHRLRFTRGFDKESQHFESGGRRMGHRAGYRRNYKRLQVIKGVEKWIFLEKSKTS